MEDCSNQFSETDTMVLYYELKVDSMYGMSLSVLLISERLV